MGPVLSKNSNRKRVFLDGRNFAPGHFCPQSRHLVCFANKTGEVRFSTKIQSENVFFGKTNSIGLLGQNWAKFSSGTVLPPNAPYSQLGPEKRYGTGFINKIPSENEFFRMDETSLRDTFAPNRAIYSVSRRKLVRCDFVQKFNPKTCFLEKQIR